MKLKEKLCEQDKTEREVLRYAFKKFFYSIAIYWKAVFYFRYNGKIQRYAASHVNVFHGNKINWFMYNPRNEFFTMSLIFSAFPQFLVGSRLAALCSNQILYVLMLCDLPN